MIVINIIQALLLIPIGFFIFYLDELQGKKRTVVKPSEPVA